MKLLKKLNNFFFLFKVLKGLIYKFLNRFIVMFSNTAITVAKKKKIFFFCIDKCQYFIAFIFLLLIIKKRTEQNRTKILLQIKLIILFFCLIGKQQKRNRQTKITALIVIQFCSRFANIHLFFFRFKFNQKKEKKLELYYLVVKLYAYKTGYPIVSFKADIQKKTESKQVEIIAEHIIFCIK